MYLLIKNYEINFGLWIMDFEFFGLLFINSEPAGADL
jgi:hypothetical protein